jgi:hypothetical protein
MELLTSLGARFARPPSHEEELHPRSSSVYGSTTQTLLPAHLSPSRTLLGAKRQTCAETRYASVFCAQSNGHSPFAKKVR